MQWEESKVSEHLKKRNDKTKSHPHDSSMELELCIYYVQSCHENEFELVSNGR